MSEDKEAEGDNSGAPPKVKLSPEELEEAAEIMGISSLKYFDLKQNRTQNYVFSFDHLLDPRGNTGVYLIYAYARIASILRKVNYDESKVDQYVFQITNEAERNLAMTILKLPEAIEQAADRLEINRITDQLYEISQRVGEMYHAVRVVGSPEENSRVALLVATKKIMEVCFQLLGMKTLQKL